MGIGQGASFLFRGFGMWSRRPGLMLLGIVPALLVLVVLLSAFITLLVLADDLVAWATPFADDWGDTSQDLLRWTLVVLLVVGAGFLAVVTFTGLTLALGDPFYERIWRETERMLGGDVPEHGVGWVRAVKDGAVLIGLGMLTSICVFLIGLLPLVGALVGSVLGVVVSGRLLAGELVSRPLEARGMDRTARAALLRDHRGAMLGFGVVTQLCFMVPLGAVVVMPAAVVGATMLAREALDTTGRPASSRGGR